MVRNTQVQEALGSHEGQVIEHAQIHQIGESPQRSAQKMELVRDLQNTSTTQKKCIRFTKHALLALMSKGVCITVKDTQLQGFQFKVGQKRSVFQYEKRISGKSSSGKTGKPSSPITFTIGAFPAVSIEEARKEAMRLAGLCEQGIDPRAEKRKTGSTFIPLGEALERFFESKADLRTKSFRTYQYIVKNHFPARWYSLDIRSITTDMLVHQFHEIQKTTMRGRYFLKTFHNVYVTCSTIYRDEKEETLLAKNPAPLARTLVKHVKSPAPRRSVVSQHLLGKFLVTVEGIRSGEISLNAEGNCRSVLAGGHRRMCDIALLSLFTAFRFNEARCLKWECVDLVQGVIHMQGTMQGVFEGTKNHLDHFVPLSSGARDLLLRIKEESVLEGRVSPFVFPAERDLHKPTSRKEEVFQRVSEILGTHYSPHASRRTFASVADAAGLGFLTVKRMLNHSFEGGVTGGYVVQGFHPEKDRVHFQKVCDYILECRASYLGQVVRDSGEVDRAMALEKLRRYALELGLEEGVIREKCKSLGGGEVF